MSEDNIADSAKHAAKNIGDKLSDAAHEVTETTDQAARDVGETVGETARDSAKIAGDAAKDIGGKMGETTRDAMRNAADMAADLGARSKAKGADAIAGMGRAVREVADDISDEAPAVAGYMRDTAKTIDKVAEGLRTHTMGDLVDTVTHFGRQQPVAFFAGAIVAGFALSRLVKSGMRSRHATEAEDDQVDVSRAGY